MDKKKLPAALSLASVIITSGGGILVRLAPPGYDDTIIAIAVSLFVLASVSMLVKAAINLLPHNKYVYFAWSVTALISIFLVAYTAMRYYSTYDSYVVRSTSSKRHVIGKVMTPTGKKEKDDDPNITNVELIDKYRNPEEVWTAESIKESKTELMWRYYMVVISIGLMLFSSLELGLTARLKNKVPEQ